MKETLLPPGLVLALVACAATSVACGGKTYDLGFAGPDLPSSDGGDAAPGSGAGKSGFDEGDASTAPSPSSVCSPASVSCSGGATGYACNEAGVTPRVAQPSLSCSYPMVAGIGVTDFCCFDFTPDQGQGCVPLDQFACGENSYAYECVPGSLPSKIDARLSCGDNFPAANGSNDFCCSLH